MPIVAQPRLNRSFVLRYDHAHETVSVDKDDVDEELEAQIDSILGSDRETPDSLGLGDDHMDVNGISGVARAQTLGGVAPAQDIETPATNALSPQDEVQISSAAQAMDELSRTADVRMERIAQIKQDIADGVYETEERMNAALDRFLDAYGLNDD